MTGPPTSSREGRGALVRLGALVAAGLLVGGAGGAVIAALGWLAAQRAGAVAPLAGALGCLVVAGLATGLEQPLRPGDISLAFATERPLANSAGRAATLLLLVALASLASSERSPVRTWTPAHRRLRATSMALACAAVAVAIGIAGVVHEVAAPEPLNGRELAAVRTLRATGELPLGRSSDVAPVAAVVGAFSPGSAARAAAWLAALAVLLLVVQVGDRRPRAWVATAALAALTPAVTQLALGPTVAVAALSAANLLAPSAARPGRAFAGGALGGLALLAAPESAVAIVVLAAWPLVAVSRTQRATAVVRSTVVMAGVALAVLPWLLASGSVSAPRPEAASDSTLWAAAFDALVLALALAGARVEARSRAFVFVALAAFVATLPTALVGLDDRWMLAPVVVPIAGGWLGTLARPKARSSSARAASVASPIGS